MTIAELESYIEDIRFKLAISPDHPIGAQLAGALAELAALNARRAHPASGGAERFQRAVRDTVTITNGAKIVGVTGQTIRNWIKQGKLSTSQREGSTVVMVSLPELEALVASKETRIVTASETRSA